MIRDRPSDPYNFIADQRLGGHITGMCKSGIVGKWALPSGISKITMENHHVSYFSWENSLVLWPFSIAMWLFTRGYPSVVQCGWDIPEAMEFRSSTSARMGSFHVLPPCPKKKLLTRGNHWGIQWGYLISGVWDEYGLSIEVLLVYQEWYPCLQSCV